MPNASQTDSEIVLNLYTLVHERLSLAAVHVLYHAVTGRPNRDKSQKRAGNLLVKMWVRDLTDRPMAEQAAKIRSKLSSVEGLDADKWEDLFPDSMTVVSEGTFPVESEWSAPVDKLDGRQYGNVVRGRKSEWESHRETLEIIIPEEGKTCPSCGTWAADPDVVEELFGLRSLKGKNGYVRRPQSYCRTCRRAKQKEIAAKRKAEKEATPVADPREDVTNPWYDEPQLILTPRTPIH